MTPSHLFLSLHSTRNGHLAFLEHPRQPPALGFWNGCQYYWLRCPPGSLPDLAYLIFPVRPILIYLKTTSRTLYFLLPYSTLSFFHSTYHPLTFCYSIYLGTMFMVYGLFPLNRTLTLLFVMLSDTRPSIYYILVLNKYLLSKGMGRYPRNW